MDTIGFSWGRLSTILEENMKEINEAIASRINGWKRTRNNRINISKRLKSYDEKWNVLILCMNTLAIIFVIFSLKMPLDTGMDTVVAGCFSIYVIVLQYFLSNQDYKTRGLRFHYEQLEIEKMRYSLKKLLNDNSLEIGQKQEKYDEIVDQYLISLKNNENHASIDDDLTREEKKSNKKWGKNKVRDFSLDNLFLYANVCIFFGGIFLVVWLYK